MAPYGTAKSTQTLFHLGSNYWWLNLFEELFLIKKFTFMKPKLLI